MSSTPGPDLTVHLWHRVCGTVSGYIVQVVPPSEKAELAELDQPSVVLAVRCDCPSPDVPSPYSFAFLSPAQLWITYVESPEIARDSFGLMKSLPTVGSVAIEYVPAIKMRP